jgi:formate hydrogenlyase subunit 3/multisubunit Na+/H+ antiporter MnhD subunit
MNIIISFILVLISAIVLIPFIKGNWKGIIVFSAVVINVILSSYFAINALSGQLYDFVFSGSYITGLVHVRIDALSAWFILILNFVFVTGGFYGLFYLRSYNAPSRKITLHSISFVLLHAALVGICVIQNSMVFLVAWELLALSAFITIIFENEKMATIHAGINYLIQSHISIVFLMIGFMWVAHKTGSYDFNAISEYASSNNGNAAIVLFLCFFVTFAIKAGLVPFHTWLPYAHPAAPAHISGIMSGVIIKIGIFGILRMLLLIKPDYTTVGYFILIISLISGLYGVMLAIIQHNLKKLLAYHSIENIGIIGIGIGIGCIGLGSGNQIIATLGFTGAMLHTLNHALFKSVLFYTSGNVYQATHTLSIEHLGGLIKKMPQTAILFLISAIAICGIPPFNGFISEFIIYTGLYNWLKEASLFSSIAAIVSVLSLVMIGGLAMLCFTKAFGIIFLGNARQAFKHEIKEVSFFQLAPMYLITLLIVTIGLFPQIFINLLLKPVGLFTNINQFTSVSNSGNAFEIMQQISWIMWGFVVFVILLYFVRKVLISKKIKTIQPTWGCAYIAPTSKQQYTASSFVKSYSKIFGMFFLMNSKKENNVQGIFPSSGHLETHPYDKLEKWVIDNPIRSYKSFMGKFLFLQNGKLQFYLLYGIVFIVSVICIPLFYEKICVLIDFLKRL